MAKVAREVPQVAQKESGDKTALVINAAMLYAARVGMPDAPRNADGSIGGQALAAWFKTVCDHANTHPSAFAAEFIDLLNGDLPEA